MIYKFTTIAVKDLEESLKFYTEIVSLSILNRFSPRQGIDIAFLKDENNNKMELIQNDLENPNFDNCKSIVTIGFGVNDLDETIRFLNEKQVRIARGPVPISNGRFIVVDDPNGVGIGFYEEK